jgi:hypothetical protein
MKEVADRLVVIATFLHPYEAHIARTVLESEGIQARLDGEHHIAMDWMISNAVGGVKLIVHERDEVVAKKILSHPDHEINDEQTGDTAKPAKPTEVCPFCQSEDIHLEKLNRGLSLISILFMGFPVPFLKRSMVCDRCERSWKPK